MLVPPDALADWSKDALRTLYWDGIVRLPWRWPANDIAEYVSHMRWRPVYNAHVKAKSDGVPRSCCDTPAEEVLSYDMADALAAPHFFPFALQFTEFARDYLGQPPLMYSLNAFWTRPGSSRKSPDIQEWHRDRDDTKFLALFMLATDVDDDAHGPHLYAKGTHRLKDDGNHPPRGEPVERITGPAGTCWICDPRGLHIGLKPHIGERLLCWARWGVSNPPASYSWDKLAPAPLSKFADAGWKQAVNVLDPAMAASTRLIVDWAA